MALVSESQVLFLIMVLVLLILHTWAVEHNLNSILSVGIGSSGVGYGEGSATTLHGAKLVGVGLGSTS